MIAITLPRSELLILWHCFPELIGRDHNSLPLWRVGLSQETTLSHFWIIEYLSLIIANLRAVNIHGRLTEIDVSLALIKRIHAAFGILFFTSTVTVFLRSHGVIGRETVTLLVDGVDKETVVGTSALRLLQAFRRLLLKHFVLIVFLVLCQRVHVNLIYGS